MLHQPPPHHAPQLITDISLSTSGVVNFIPSCGAPKAGWTYPRTSYTAPATLYAKSETFSIERRKLQKTANRKNAHQSSETSAVAMRFVVFRLHYITLHYITLINLYTASTTSLMRWISANCAEYSIYRIKMFSAGVWNDQMKGLVTSDNPVEHSSRLDQRHWRLTVCSEVWPGCWSWQTEAYHGDLLTQRWANTVRSGKLEPCYADTCIL